MVCLSATVSCRCWKRGDCVLTNRYTPIKVAATRIEMPGHASTSGVFPVIETARF